MTLQRWLLLPLVVLCLPSLVHAEEDTSTPPEAAVEAAGAGEAPARSSDAPPSASDDDSASDGAADSGTDAVTTEATDTERVPEVAPAPEAQKAASKVRVIVLDLNTRNVSSDDGAMLGGLIVVHLNDYGSLDVVSNADVREIMALEGEKQSMGCEDSSCLAEIAGAMGARLVVFGDLGKLGSRYLLSLNLFDSEKARSEGRVALTADSLDGLVNQLGDAVHQLLQRFLVSQGMSAERRGSSSLQAAPTPAPAAPPAIVEEDAGGIGWIGWTGATLGVLGTLGYLAATTVAIAVAQDMEAPYGVQRAFAAPFGLAVVATVVQASGGEPNGAFGLVLAAAAVQVVSGLTAAGGTLTWGSAVLLDQPALTTTGHAWRWGLIGGGLALLAGGAVLDQVPFESTANLALDPLDFVPPGLYAVGAAAAFTGLLFNPFVDEEALAALQEGAE